LEPPAETGLVVANPPYGGRIGRGTAASAYRALGEAMRGALAGWRLAFVTPHPRLAAATGLELRPGPTLPSGGLRLRLYTWDPASCG
ncbi:MAG: class I SAM-dependent RNA methyltransferase, partial [Deltaproteobacteria bacterium]